MQATIRTQNTIGAEGRQVRFWQVHVRYSDVMERVKLYGLDIPSIRGKKMFDMSGGLSPELVELRKLDLKDFVKEAIQHLPAHPGRPLPEPEDSEEDEREVKVEPLRAYLGYPEAGHLPAEGEQVRPSP